MEIKAIEKAAIKLEQDWHTNPYLAREAEIMVDSQAAILALDNEMNDSAEVLKCKQALNQAGALGTITIKWIKAHVNLMGNELADQAAKAGVTDPAAPETQCL